MFVSTSFSMISRITVVLTLTLFFTGNVVAGGDGKQKEVVRTWENGLIFFPTPERFEYGPITDHLHRAGDRFKNEPLPAIIYMHGCAGVNAVALQVAREFALNGYVVFIPDSFAREYKPQSCDIVTREAGMHREVIGWRHDEGNNAIRQVRKLDWVQQDKVFLIGLSEGGLTSATLSGEPVTARVIEGWVCHSTWKEYNGLNAPANEPVLALLGEKDPWFQYDWAKGDCGDFMNRENGSRSVVYKEKPLSQYHWLTWHPEPLREILSFLDAHKK